MGTKVFIPHNATKYDPVKGRDVPLFNLKDAARFGSLTCLLDSADDVLFPEQMTKTIESGLASVSVDDYFLAIGDPSSIAICSGVILRKLGCIKLLKWDRMSRTYILVEVKLS